MVSRAEGFGVCKGEGFRVSQIRLELAWDFWRACQGNLSLPRTCPESLTSAYAKRLGFRVSGLGFRVSGLGFWV